MAKKAASGNLSHLDSKGFKKKFPVKQHKIVFSNKGAVHPLSNGGVKSSGSSKASSGGGVKGGKGYERDDRGRFS